MRIFCSVVYLLPFMVWVLSGFPDQLSQWLSFRNPDHWSLSDKKRMCHYMDLGVSRIITDDLLSTLSLLP